MEWFLAVGWLEVELFEGLSVLFLQLVFDYYLIRLNLDFLYRLREQEPDEAPVGQLISVWQSSSKLGNAQNVSPQQLTSRGEEKWEADVLNFLLTGALKPQALC